MASTYIAVCRSCGSEFQSHVTRCIDCGGATEPRWESPEMAALAAQAPRLKPTRPLPPPPGQLFSLAADVEACTICTAHLDGAMGLAHHLEEHGVPCRVDPAPNDESGDRYVVGVAVEDRERAAAAERELFARLLPEAGAALSAEFPPGHCPACGAQVPAAAVECLDCGLVVGGAPDEEMETDSE